MNLNYLIETARTLEQPSAAAATEFEAARDGLAYEPEVLAQTALWVFRAYRSHGFPTAYWPANLDTFVEIARERLGPQAFAETYPFFHWLIVDIPSFVKISDEQLSEPLSPAPRHEPTRLP